MANKKQEIFRKKNTGYQTMIAPLSRARTIKVRENPILFLNSMLKNTFKKVISIMSMRAFGFNYSFESIRIT
jgi:hypothetical protein